MDEVKNLVYIVNNAWCPHNKAADVASKYIEVLKKFPPDPSLGKIVLILIRPFKDYLHVLGIHKIKKGKLADNFLRAIATNHELTNVEGFKYEVDTYMDMSEAYDIIELKAPDV